MSGEVRSIAWFSSRRIGERMNYTIAAIETRYNGANFRSRLEAKWAAMFDLLGWGWTYEPTDFNGWIPDFAIHGRETIYVEVKPVDAFPQDVADKIDASGCRNEVLIVGTRGPVRAGEYQDHPIVGWLREMHLSWLSVESFVGEEEPVAGWWWGDAALGRWGSPPGGKIGFCHADGSFADRITGGYDGGHYGNGNVTIREVELLWREAGNRTRWNRK
jgi:hypothetical protein